MEVQGKMDELSEEIKLIEERKIREREEDNTNFVIQEELKNEESICCRREVRI